jgi:hypothetical protein
MDQINVFKTEDFEIDFNIRRIRFFRNRFPYSSLPFDEVKSVELTYGRVVKNAWILFLFATFLACTAFILIARLLINFEGFIWIENLTHSDIRSIGTYLIISLSLLFFSGFIFYATRKQIVLKINGGKHLLPLKEIISEGLLDQFQSKLKPHFPEEWIEKRS